MMKVQLISLGSVEISEDRPDGEWRRAIAPGEDISDLPQNIQSIIEEYWTEERVNGYNDWLESQRPPSAPLAARIKFECSRRILVVLRNELTQLNMTAAGAALTRKESLGTITANELTTLNLLSAGQAWVPAMQAKSRELITANDETYANDSHWPAPPAGLAELALTF